MTNYDEKITEVISIIKAERPNLSPELTKVRKNTVELNALTIKDASVVSPCIYIDKYLADDLSATQIAINVLFAYDASVSQDIPVDELLNKDYVLNNLYIGLQRRDTNANFIWSDTEFDDVVMFMYIRGSSDSVGNYSVKLTESLLKQLDIEEAVAWDIAKNTTASELQIDSIFDVISSMLDINDIDQHPEATMYVVSNKSKTYGAGGVVANLDYIKSWAKEHNFADGIILIFSSIHEALLIPASCISVEQASEMCAEVNSTQVEATEVLSDKAFFIPLD